MVTSLQEDKYVDIYSNSSVRKIKHISRSVAVSSVKYISDSPVEETRMIIVAIKIVGTAQAVSTPVVFCDDFFVSQTKLDKNIAFCAD